MQSIRQDIRFAVRMLLKQPGFSLIAIITLALGIGANTAIFSVINAVLLRPLPYADPDRLVYLKAKNDERGIASSNISPPDFLDLRNQSQTFERVAAIVYGGSILTGEGEAERVPASGVTEDFFPAMGVATALGRTFASEESGVAVIGYAMWQRRYGGDSSVLGKTLLTNRQPVQIIGVMPAGFDYPDGSELWVPLNLKGDEARSNRYLQVIARLKAEVSLSEAQSESQTIAHNLAEQYTDTNRGWNIAAYNLSAYTVREIRTALMVILGAAGFVLLIACANVANLLFARATARRKEIAIRIAMGASRGRVIRQLLTESLMLALIGGLIALLAAWWGLGSLIALAPASLPRVSEATIDPGILVFTLLVSVVTGILFGLVPALQLSKPDLNESLKETSRGSTLWSHQGSSLLVISEIALSIVLLIGAALMIESFIKLVNVRPGFDPKNVLTMRMVSTARDRDQRAAFFQQAIDRVRALPGVESVGATLSLPLRGGGFYVGRGIIAEGRRHAPENELSADYRAVTPGYFETLKIQIVKGRLFDHRDEANALRSIIINETLARRLFPDTDAVGKKIAVWRDEQFSREIVGIINDMKTSSLDSETPAEMYVPFAQDPWPGMTLVIRSSIEPAGLVSAVRDEVKAIDRDQPMWDIRTMERVLANSTARERFNALLLGIFAALALLLATVGIYGVVSYSVSERTREIGVRMALGASHSDVTGLVLRKGLWLSVTGVAVGLTGAAGLTRLMESLLFEVSATDPVIFAGIAALIVAVSLLACYIPAHRAAQIDPMVALRYE